jgi:hypothetical protein
MTVTNVRVGSADDYLLLTPDESDPIVQTVIAELSSSGLRAIRTVVHSYSTGFADLADFFAQLEQDWRGWDATRSRRSLEGDLDIEARHEFGQRSTSCDAARWRSRLGERWVDGEREYDDRSGRAAVADSS